MGLSPATSANLSFSVQHYVWRSQGTAGVKPEEGGGDVKSSRPLCLGLQTCYNGRYKGQQGLGVEPIHKDRSRIGLKAAARLHEIGDAKNRGSAYRSEYVPGPFKHGT